MMSPWLVSIVPPEAPRVTVRLKVSGSEPEEESVPPSRVRAPEPRAESLLTASVPPVTVVPPVNVLSPERVSVLPPRTTTPNEAVAVPTAGSAIVWA